MADGSAGHFIQPQRRLTMHLKKSALILLSAALLFSGACVSEASLWPGLASKVSEKSGAFRTDDYHVGNANLMSPYLITRSNNTMKSRISSGN